MAEFVFNGIVLNRKDSIENLMIKQLTSKYGNVTKELDSTEFVKVLMSANFTNSLDLTILKLKKFSFDLSNETNLELIKPYLVTCMEHSILKLNKQIKASKINNASFYRAAGANNNQTINEEFIDARAFYDECDFLINYLTNAVVCGEIIYLAEHQAIYTLKQNKTQLENETTIIVDKYIRKNLNMEEILNAKTKEQLSEVLKHYKKGTPTLN
ncbi:MAG: hypothetical protein IJE91_03270 [Clostridia bacterium]|nr:hypothetical protein [Clostridia bacterium]